MIADDEALGIQVVSVNLFSFLPGVLRGLVFSPNLIALVFCRLVIWGFLCMSNTEVPSVSSLGCTVIDLTFPRICGSQSE